MPPTSRGAPPRSSSRRRRSSPSRAGSAPRDWGSQPSPSRAARRRAAGDEPPTQMGGRGDCTGRGPSATPDAGQRGPSSVGLASASPRARAVDGFVGGLAALVRRPVP